MARHLSLRHVELIIGLHDRWPAGTVLARRVLRACLRSRMLSVPSRQVLARRPRTQAAHGARKAGLRTETVPSVPEIVVSDPIRRSKTQTARLRSEHRALLQRVNRWMYSA